MKYKLFYLDDELRQLEHFDRELGRFFAIETSQGPFEALDRIRDAKFDAIICDLHMPIINGYKFFEMLTENKLNNTPFFFLSSDPELDSKISCLKLGAVDFLSPSMSPEEKYIRVFNRINDVKLVFKHLSIDLKNVTAYSGGVALDLTQIEFKILLLLLKKSGGLVGRDELREFIWPNLKVMDKTINSHLTNLRAKIENENFKIISIKGQGILCHVQ